SWRNNIDKNKPLLEAFHSLIKMQFTTDHLMKMRKLVSLTRQSPTLVPYILNATHRLKKSAQKVLSELSEGRYTEEYIQMLTGAVYGAVIPLYDGSLNILLTDENPKNSEDINFEEYLNTLFNHLRKGF